MVFFTNSTIESTAGYPSESTKLSFLATHCSSSMYLLASLAPAASVDSNILRILAFKFDELGYHTRALSLYRILFKLRPEEPQTALALGVSLLNHANRLLSEISDISTEQSKNLISEVGAFYEEAIGLLVRVILGKWDVRFHQIEQIALMDLNRLINFLNFWKYKFSEFLQISEFLKNSIDQRLVATTTMEIDLRVVIEWSTDMSDVELHVTEPSGETCYAFNINTVIGGLHSRDFSKGYGPEEYLLRYAPPGDYLVFVKLFSAIPPSHPRVFVKVSIYTSFGNPEREKVVHVTTLLDHIKQKQHVATISIE